MVIEMIVVVLVSFTVYVYLGYPLILWSLARVRERPIRREPVRPTVSLIIPAHNEEDIISSKIGNCLALDYPADALEVLVVSNGSTDATDTIVSRFTDPRVRLVSLGSPGKAQALNEGVRLAKGEILVFTDANSMLEPGSLANLVASFADPEVGGVCGNQRYRLGTNADSTGGGENLYWRLDKWIKRLESRTGSIFAADGSLYAVRRELYVPIHDPAQADDIAVSTRVVLGGHRLIFEPSAVCYEEAPHEGRLEFRRKIRVTNHSVRALLGLGRRLWTSGFYSFELLSHKLFRHLVPFALIPLFVLNLTLIQGSAIFRALFALQLVFYGLAITGATLRTTSLGKRKPFSIPYFFCLANTAAFLGVLSILLGRRVVGWSPRSGSGLPTEATKGSTS